MILLLLWRGGFWRRADREKLRFFLGRGEDPLLLSRRYPLWRTMGLWRALTSRQHAAGLVRWLEYRMNLYDGIEG